MNLHWRSSCFLISILVLSCSQKADVQFSTATQNVVSFSDDTAHNKIDVLVDGNLFTSCRWPEGVFKPVLYPIISAGGKTITRGYPLEPRPGESTDHRHQVGNWLNYGNVNGFDFWGNGHTGERLPNGGEIRHNSVDSKSEGEGEATLVTSSSWLDPRGKELLQERTEYHFIADDSVRIIDRICTLTAIEPVVFADTKEGMFGLRVSRELELPSQEKIASASGSDSSRTDDNIVATGNYRSSEGITGEQVWSSRARWMNLYGMIGDEKISVVICDHPDNPSYPTWWHARPYGLFSANPLGAKDFTKGGEVLNFTLPAGKSTTFRYRIIVASGTHMSDDAINAHADDFAKKY